MKYQSKVLSGDQQGRTIGIKTVNLDVSILPENFKTGIYAAKVFYQEKEYLGALYFGPRLVKHETHNQLEIHILDFDKEIYEEIITFSIDTFIRDIMDFDSMEEMKIQIEKDIREIKHSYNKSPK